MKRIDTWPICSRVAFASTACAAGVAFHSSILAQLPPQPTPSGQPSWEATVNSNNSTSIVFIKFSGTRENGLQDEKTGTGFIITAEGHVITCSHVVPPTSEYQNVKVTAIVGSRYGTEYPLDDVIDRTEQFDLVLLKLPPIATPWQSVQHIAKGKVQAQILSLGFPLDQNMLGIPGAITGQGKRGRWITNTALNKGMSGGPVFDKTGAVVAIVAAGREDANEINELIPISFATNFFYEIGSPVVAKQNQAVQRSSEEINKIDAKFEKSQAVLASKELTPNQSAQIQNLLEKGNTSKTEWNTLYNQYLELNRAKPGRQSASDRQQIVTEMKGVVAKFDMVNAQVSAFAH